MQPWPKIGIYLFILSSSFSAFNCDDVTVENGTVNITETQVSWFSGDAYKLTCDMGYQTSAQPGRIYEDTLDCAENGTWLNPQTCESKHHK